MHARETCGVISSIVKKSRIVLIGPHCDSVHLPRMDYVEVICRVVRRPSDVSRWDPHRALSIRSTNCAECVKVPELAPTVTIYVFAETL